MVTMLRVLIMAGLITAGWWWLRPRAATRIENPPKFIEQAELAGCLNVHTPVRLSDDFANIMPWLSAVGAAAAAGDFDNDGFADLYVTRSGRGDTNRLFHNRGDGTFDEVAAEAGVECGNAEGGCMHAVWGDIDNDGYLDLYVVKWGGQNSLFHNDGNGHFTNITDQSGVGFWGYGNGATFLDYDRDGWLDLFVANYFPETVPDPKDPTGQKRVRNDLWRPVTTRVMHETFTHARNGGRNVLYHNRGNGTFDEVSESLGIHATLWSLAVGSGDLNNDGWPDIYVANDFGPDELYLNTGATEAEPRFRAVVDPRGHPGVGADWWKGMNVDMADVNNDGYLDIYVTNIFEGRYKTDEGNMLWMNCADAACPGGRGFRNIARTSGTFDGGWGWGGKFADFNNDGLLDIFTVNGFVSGSPDRNYWFAVQEMVTQTKNQTIDARDWPAMENRDLSGHEHPRLFVQTPPRISRPNASPADSDEASRPAPGDPNFVECAMETGITDTFNGRAIAVADFDRDGRLDIYVANQAARSCYYVNRTHETEKHSIELTLVGRPDAPLQTSGRCLASSRCAVGARVMLQCAGVTQTREVQGGQGFAAQSEYAVHFGVPDASAADVLVIRWPSGRSQEISGLALLPLLGRNTVIVERVEGDAGTPTASRPALESAQ